MEQDEQEDGNTPSPPEPDQPTRANSAPVSSSTSAAAPHHSSPPRRTRFNLPEPLSSLDTSSATTTRSNSPEPLPTPTLADSYGTLKKNLSFKSLRELEVRQLSEHIYRKGSRAEKRSYRPKNDDEVFSHALRGGIRSLILGSSLRACVNLAIVLLRLTRKRGIRPALILHALFGTDTIRFGGMLGIFTFLFARVTIGQQLFVRGLQGHYNQLKTKGVVNVKNVSVLVFGFSCAQIMYSWLMAPEALPSGYRRWITQASRVAEPCLPIQISTSRRGVFDPAIAREAITWGRGATEKNAKWIEEYARRGEAGDFGPPFVPCEVVHPWMDSCTGTALDRWQAVFRWIAPVYAGLHFIPPIVLRRKVFLKNPQSALLKSLLGTLRSCSFLSTFVVLFQGLVCFQRNVYNEWHGRVPVWVEKLIVHKMYYWLVGFSTCLALFIEEKKRRRELAMYVLPRGLESLWSILRRRSYVPFVPGGDVLLTSVGLAMVMQTYQHEPQQLSGLVRTLLYQFVGHG
ncbi:hypothetical protein JCM6882_007115 [Rhodosporidiobolus microsporus]